MVALGRVGVSPELGEVALPVAVGVDEADVALERVEPVANFDPVGNAVAVRVGQPGAGLQEVFGVLREPVAIGVAAGAA